MMKKLIEEAFYNQGIILKESEKLYLLDLINNKSLNEATLKEFFSNTDVRYLSTEKNIVEIKEILFEFKKLKKKLIKESSRGINGNQSNAYDSNYVDIYNRNNYVSGIKHSANNGKNYTVNITVNSGGDNAEEYFLNISYYLGRKKVKETIKTFSNESEARHAERLYLDKFGIQNSANL